MKGLAKRPYETLRRHIGVLDDSVRDVADGLVTSHKQQAALTSEVAALRAVVVSLPLLRAGSPLTFAGRPR